MSLKQTKLLPMVVSLPLFLQNIDSSIMGPALPAMAASLHVETLRLNLAITAYLISLAIFLPLSGWLADRLGARRVFCGAIVVFSLASALCGFATSLEMLVACRVLQGLGGAMMVPVGRLILLNSVPKENMIAAMVWFTVPPVLGRLIGPLVGGVTVTWLSWNWIFLVNVPVGLIAIALALALIDDDGEPAARRSFDFLGFVLLGIGLASFLAALESASGHLVDAATTLGLAVFGLAGLLGYAAHSRRTAEPLIDLRILRHTTFFVSVIGALPLRMVIGAMPFLLPLLFQLGFGLSPLDSGLLTMGTALGSLCVRPLLARSIGRFGYRRLLIGATLCASLCYVVYAQFSPATPHAAVFATTMVAGLVMSAALISLQTLAFTEVSRPLMGHATALSAMVQQVSISLGVLLAAGLLRVAVLARGGSVDHLQAHDFPPAFFSIAAVVLLSLVSFRRLRGVADSDLRGT